jgi:hypothetical protein
MKSTIFWDITPFSPLSVNRRFGGTYRLHLQDRKNKFTKKACSRVSCWTYFLDPEDGGDMFLRNVCWHSMDYMALYPRRWYSLYMLCYFTALSVAWWDDRWMRNLKGFGRKRSWSNRSTILAFAWRYWAAPRHTSVRTADVRYSNWAPAEFESRRLRPRQLAWCHETSVLETANRKLCFPTLFCSTLANGRSSLRLSQKWKFILSHARAREASATLPSLASTSGCCKLNWLRIRSGVSYSWL